MSLQPGTRLGSYEIQSAIGRGGMGEVYRARDTSLNRDVAIKVLPEDLAEDPERLARFQREAEVLASLNHSSIGQIYGLEKVVPSTLRPEDTRGTGPAHATPALVLELVEGPTLEDRIAQGAVPIEEALPIARQIADALEAAHERGIIHRDLKPANIKVTPDGAVKVLDFGLAKAIEGSTAGQEFSPADEVANSPTRSMSAAATRAGFILGTAAYMSPEQARGKPVDKRSDIWSFGVVLFEMLSGTQLFDGPSVSDTIAAVLRESPDERALPDATPAPVRRLLRRCLRKDRAKRLPDIGVARMEIDEALSDPETDTSVVPEPRDASPVGRALTLALAGLALLILGGLATWALVRESSEPAPVMRLSIPLPEPAGRAQADWTTRRIAISPDGTRIAYFDAGGLSVRRLDEEGWLRVPGTEFGDSPFFSPDGEWIGFHQDARLMKVASAGGTPALLCNTGPFYGGSWGEDGTIVFANVQGLQHVADSGGEPALVVDAGRSRLTQPLFLPGGSAVLFTEVDDSVSIGAVSLRTGERRRVLDDAGVPHYLSTGHLLYSSLALRRTFAVPFDPEGLQTQGQAAPVLDDTRFDRVTGAQQLAVSRSGHAIRIGGSSEAPERSLVWVDRAGVVEPLSTDPGWYTFPALSPDGSRLAFAARQETPFDADVWILDLGRSVPTRLTFAPNSGPAVWSADGSRLVFASSRDSTSRFDLSLFVKRADGTGNAERVVSGGVLFPYVWTDDGQVLATVFDRDTQVDIASLDIEGPGEPRVLVGTPASETRPALSPDGRWLAYNASESGQNEVYVRPFPDVESGRWQISTGGGHSPRWIAAADELVYRARDRMMSVSFETSAGFVHETPRPLFDDDFVNDAGGTSYDVTPDGQRFIMIQESRQDDTAADRIDIMLNFAAEVETMGTRGGV